MFSPTLFQIVPLEPSFKHLSFDVYWHSSHCIQCEITKLRGAQNRNARKVGDGGVALTRLNSKMSSQLSTEKTKNEELHASWLVKANKLRNWKQI